MTSRGGGCLDCLKDDFNLNSIPSSAFYHGQWDSGGKDGQPTVPYLIYRFLFMVSLISAIAGVMTCRGPIFYIFFTYWTLYLQCLYGTLYFLCIVWRKYFAQRFRGRAQVRDVEQQVSVPGRDVIPSEIGAAEVVPSRTRFNVETVSLTDWNPSSSHSYRIKSVNDNSSRSVLPVTSRSKQATAANDNGGGRLTCLEKVICILMNITQTIPFIVTVVYWVKVYKYEDFGPCKTISNYYITHSANSVVALIDAVMVGIPARWTHFVFPATYISIYMLFTYLYEVAGGKYRDDPNTMMEMNFIYAQINWKETPKNALGFVLAAVFASCVFHTMICWGIYKIKLSIASSPSGNWETF